MSEKAVRQRGFKSFFLLISICIVFTVVFIKGWFPSQLIMPSTREIFASHRNPIDPKSICLVFISGFQPGNSQYLRQELQQEVFGKEKPHTNTNINSLIGQLNSTPTNFGQTGMQILRNRFAEILKPYGVPEDNILYMRWTESTQNRYSYKSQPEYAEMVKKINDINPSYLALFGHSYGGCTAIRISRKTLKTPDFIGLYDPVFVPASIDAALMRIESAPQDSNVDNYPRGKQIINWYQTNTWPNGIGKIYDSFIKPVENIQVLEATHTSIDNDPVLQEEAVNNVMQAIKSSLLLEKSN